MLVHDNRKNTTSFGNLDAGDVFIMDGEAYMKVDGKDINAVKLDIGETYHLFDNTLVLEVRATVSIESY